MIGRRPVRCWLVGVSLLFPALVAAQTPVLTQTITGTATQTNASGATDTAKVRVTVTTRVDTAGGKLVLDIKPVIDSLRIRYGTRTSGGGTPVPIGIPFGGFALPSSHTFTLEHTSNTPSTIVSAIATARAKGRHLVLVMTGGAHANYMTSGAFDLRKWTARLDLFDTPEIQAAITQGVADGTIVGASVMDEPHNTGGGDGNTWCDPGKPCPTKALVDSLCGAVQARFPTLNAGVAHSHDVFEPTKSYRVCQFIIAQYSSRHGSVTTFRDGGLALARRDGHAVMFSVNVLNGGTQDRTGAWDCPTTGTGTYAPNCRMTAAQITSAALVVGPASCGGLLFWRWDATLFGQAAIKSAVQVVADALGNLPRTACKRTA